MSPELMLRAFNIASIKYANARVDLEVDAEDAAKTVDHAIMCNRLANLCTKLYNRLLSRLNGRCENCRHLETYRDCCDEWQSWCNRFKISVPEDEDFGCVLWRGKK